MQNIFKEKIIECLEITKLMLFEHYKLDDSTEHELALYKFLDKSKINGNNSFQELWNSYGFTPKNLALLNLSTFDTTVSYRANYQLMEKWVAILFLGKIKFKTFFDMEIEAHNKLRETAAKKGIHRLNLSVNFSNIAVYIDRELGSVSLPKTVVAETRKALIMTHYDSVIDAELVNVLNTISLEDFCTGKNAIVVDWIKNAEGYPEQLISEKLKTLLLFINSIAVSTATGKNYPILIYAALTKSKLKEEMYKTLEVIEWLFNGKSDLLAPEFEDLITYCKEKFQ